MRKILFLDFDGVLNNREWCGTHTMGPDHIDPNRVRLVEEICAATGCVIVISSAWRYWHSLDTLVGLLRSKGLTAQVIGTTPLVHQWRGREIGAWRSESGEPGDVYCALDDDFIGAAWHVRTSFEVGLTPDHIVQAIQILGATSNG